jgi:DNA modification methylase
MAVRIIVGDCREKMAEMEPASVDAIVCDPPYGLEFMGKGWDHGVPGVPFWTEARRVLKPGGHLLAFGGTRTHHRLMVAIEDAGFEIRDCLMWLYGSGFPKSLDVSKAIDKAAGAQRDPGTPGPFSARRPASRRVEDGGDAVDWHYGDGNHITAPATEAAREWDGWGTALKPAWEPIVMARKPLSGTVASNVQAFGTGALNIDGCRIEHTPGSEGKWGTKNAGNTRSVFGSFADEAGLPGSTRSEAGRWPANLALDPEAAAMLDAQSGESKSPNKVTRGGNRQQAFGMARQDDVECYGDTGGASRFFKTVKEDDTCIPANDAARHSSQQSAHDDSVPSGAATAAGNGQSYPEPSTNGTPSESRQSGENATQPTRYIGQKFSQGSLLQSESNPDRVSAAGPNEPTDTTTTTGNRSPSGSSAESATSQSMSSSEAVGDQDFAGNRFWYTAKASRAERNKGLDGLPERDSMKWSGGSEQMRGVAGTYPDGSPRPEQHAKNHHPTVKPLDLMQWLVRLVTPKGGTVLDPFCGSGSTLVAADREGFDAIGIDLDPEYAEIARRRFVGDAPLFAEVIE